MELKTIAQDIQEMEANFTAFGFWGLNYHKSLWKSKFWKDEPGLDLAG